MGNLLASLYTGNTGLGVSGAGISVVGDNIANSNTVGFKAGRAHFQDLLSQTLVGTRGSGQIGRGASLQRIEKLFTQGSLQSTGVPTDMAIEGNGFFAVSGAHAGSSEIHYTRAGQFRFDDEGFMVNPAGLRVQGYGADEAGNMGAILDDMRLTQRTLDPQATRAIELRANLSPDAPEGVFDPADPENTSPYRTSVMAYDSLGNPHQLDVYGTRIGPGRWEMNMLVDGGAVAGGVPGEAAAFPLGTLEFDGEGRLLNENVLNPVNVVWDGAEAANITFNFGDAINGEGGTGTAGTTQWAHVPESETLFVSQDGFGTGALESIIVNERGHLVGGYSNGRTMTLGQVALARFEDPTGLAALGGNLFAATADSGAATVGAAGTGGRGGIHSGALEQSNVELSDQFIDLISFQRSFQANSRTISSADGLLQEVLQLVR